MLGFAWPSWRWMRTNGTPSRAISIACAWGAWSGAKRRRTSADTARWRRVALAAVADYGRPAVGHPSRRAGNRRASPGAPQALVETLPSPAVHADLSTSRGPSQVPSHFAGRHRLRAHPRIGRRCQGVHLDPMGACRAPRSGGSSSRRSRTAGAKPDGTRDGGVHVSNSRSHSHHRRR